MDDARGPPKLRTKFVTYICNTVSDNPYDATHNDSGTIMKRGPREVRNFSFAASEAAVLEAGYSPPTPYTRINEHQKVGNSSAWIVDSRYQ
jgi:hypothetical protein